MQFPHPRRLLVALAAAAGLASSAALAQPIAPAPAASRHDAEAEQLIGRWRAWLPQFEQINLVANTPGSGARIVDPQLRNAWGIAIRPAGFGGHFWVTANGVRQSLEYVGDVGTTPLFQDGLKTVDTVGTPTGVVFNGGPQFVITQPHPAGAITAPAKFLFANDSGEISAWTERARPGGGFDWPSGSETVVDGAAQGSAFFGIGLSPQGDRLYAADFGRRPALRVYDGGFREQPGFPNPFQHGAALRPGDYAPFNVQTLGRPGDERVFVLYAKTQADPQDPSAFFAAEEDAGPGKGRLAEFAPDGRLLAVWHDRRLLNAPWGIALAPDDFGLYGGCLLVGNFGDGTIVAFHPRRRLALDYLRDASGAPVRIDGLWGLQFGNGASLGEANQLYFAAGPNGEEDGLFGKLVASEASLRHRGGMSLCK